MVNAHAAGRAGTVGRRTIRMNVRIQPELFAQNAGRKKCQETPLYLKKRNEHRIGGKILLAGVGRWPTSSLNLASEPRTPPVWMCARWIVFIRRKAAPMTMAARRTTKCL